MPDELPLVSVVTPSLNQGRYIEHTIASVAAQDYPRIEHVVVDGGSTDGTLEILERFEQLHWVSEPDRGQADAIRKGFGLAGGEIFALYAGMNSSMDGICAGYQDDELALLADFLRRATDAGRTATDSLATPE